MPEWVSKRIARFSLDVHRWYAVLTLEYEDGTEEVQVIGNSSDGLLVADSVEEYYTRAGA